MSKPTTDEALADVRSGLKVLRLGIAVAHLVGLCAVIENQTELDSPRLRILLEAARAFPASLEREASAIEGADRPSQPGERQR
ncbi:MAG: hypothetical protein ABIK86_05255 [candidate division WOR-3 bacterium]